MAKPLVFEFQGAPVEFQLSKVDRTKLYGYKELEVIDEQGAKCEIATLAEDGHTLVGRGGIGMGYVSADGLWCDKSQLQPVDLEGHLIQPVGSSYSAPILLTADNLVSPEDYLACTIRAIYQLDSPAGGDLEKSLKQGEIYRFAYSFRGGLESDTAFLLANEAGLSFMAVGRPALIEFVGLQQIASVIEDEPGGEEESDEMDFGMI